MILWLVVLIIGTGIGVLSLLMLSVILWDFSMIGFIVFMMMGLISMVFLYLGTNSLNSIYVDSQSGVVKIGYLGFFERNFSLDNIKGYKPEKFSNSFGSYIGTLIEVKGDRQIHLTDFDIKNYKELRDEIVKFVPRDDGIRQRRWTTFNKIAIASMVMFIIFLITYKLVE